MQSSGVSESHVKRGRRRVYEGSLTQRKKVAYNYYKRNNPRTIIQIKQSTNNIFEDYRKDTKCSKEEFILELLKLWKAQDFGVKASSEEEEGEDNMTETSSLNEQSSSDSEEESQVESIKIPAENVAFGDICFATFEQLNSLLKGCKIQVCSAKVKSISAKRIGYCCKLTLRCEENHEFQWYSCPNVAGRVAINSIVPAALLLSGGVENQFRLFCQILKLGNISRQTFYRIQKAYVKPVVREYLFKFHLPKICEELAGQRILISDGRLDSPGHCAKKCTVSFVDYHTKLIVHVENADSSQFEGMVFSSVINRYN